MNYHLSGEKAVYLVILRVFCELLSIYVTIYAVNLISLLILRVDMGFDWI